MVRPLVRRWSRVAGERVSTRTRLVGLLVALAMILQALMAWSPWVRRWSITSSGVTSSGTPRTTQDMDGLEGIDGGEDGFGCRPGEIGRGSPTRSRIFFNLVKIWGSLDLNVAVSFRMVTVE